MRPGSAKPGNVQTNWTGLTSYQADYCHPSSGNGGSTGGPALSDVQHMIESAAVGEVGAAAPAWPGLF